MKEIIIEIIKMIELIIGINALAGILIPIVITLMKIWLKCDEDRTR